MTSPSPTFLSIRGLLIALFKLFFVHGFDVCSLRAQHGGASFKRPRRVKSTRRKAAT